jgi:hypothetical protein
MKRVLTFERRNMTCKETYVGSWLGLLIYRFKMRKWKLIKIEKVA